jgi:isopentenyldiphosphate isomerase
LPVQSPAVDMAALTTPELERRRAEALASGDASLAAACQAEVAARRARHHTGEMLDVYDDSLRHLGVKERGLVHLDGDWHRSFHCWLVSPGRRSIVLQRRARTKATFPGALDVSVAGHYAAGEGLADVCREGPEELGLPLRPEELVPLGRQVDMARHGFLLDREVADVFALVTEVAPQGLRPDPAEVAAVLDLPIAAALALFRGEAGAVRAVEHVPGRPPRALDVRGADFTSHHDRYLARIALQAERLADGLPPIFV